MNFSRIFVVLKRTLLPVVFLCASAFLPSTIYCSQYVGFHHNNRVLYVNNNPFVVMSIEDHKSVDFDGHVREDYFRIAAQLHANTVSVSFRWSFFEKEPGLYDTTILRNIALVAAKYDLKVIILWFGSNISGHENVVPQYIRKDADRYQPYTRSDGSIAGKMYDDGGGRIYCYSFDGEHPNELLQREENALQALMKWVKENDPGETFIMLQLQNELFVHPELWRPWPPVYPQSAKILPGQKTHIWDERFDVMSCSLKIELSLKSPAHCEFDIQITDTLGQPFWSGYVKGSGHHEIHVGGRFSTTPGKMKLQLRRTCSDTVFISGIQIRPIAERCHCARCNEIYEKRQSVSDADFMQSNFLNYMKELSRAVSLIDRDFPLYLNLLVSGDAKKLLGNPYGQPRNYLNQIPEIDFIAPDIYLESKISVIDSLNKERNAVFIPETGRFKKRKDSDYINAFSLIFKVLGTYRGIGVQLYDLISNDYGLLTSDGIWEQDAYLVRNSYSVIGHLPFDIFYNKDNVLFGFRNVETKTLSIDDLEIEIIPNSDPKYARGIVAKANDTLVIAGIGLQAHISKKNISPQKIERGYWKNAVFISLGPLRSGSYDIARDKISIKLDDDDFSESRDFDPTSNQYCVRLILK